jgi:hypothetical protein
MDPIALSKAINRFSAFRRRGMGLIESERRVTSIQLSPEVRDRLYKLKFRKTYDEFLQELCELYERTHPN